MLGMNDIALNGIDKTLQLWETLLSRIREQTPELQITIQSMSPIWTGGEKKYLNNPNIDAYNRKLETFAAENGCEFLDVASYLKDATGGLATVYCSDEYVHLTPAGADCWIQVLKAHAEY